MERIQLSNVSFEGDNNVYLFDGDETVLVNYLGVEWFERLRLSSAARGHRPLAGSSDGVHRSSRKSLSSQTPRLRRLGGSLRRIGTRGYDRAWPGHRDVIDTPTERAAEIRHHHRERAWRVLDALRRLGPTDVWSVSADLFGSLDGIHILHGSGEVHAHLRHLHDAGSVRREQDRYRLDDGVGPRLDADGVGEWPLR
jgi:hypothetical protein